MVRARSASVTTVIGLASTNGCSQPGIEAAGAKAALANVSGNIQRNPADWAVSGLRTVRPMVAAIHQVPLWAQRNR